MDEKLYVHVWRGVYLISTMRKVDRFYPCRAQDLYERKVFFDAPWIKAHTKGYLNKCINDKGTKPLYCIRRDLGVSFYAPEDFMVDESDDLITIFGGNTLDVPNVIVKNESRIKFGKNSSISIDIIDQRLNKKYSG